MVNSPGFLSNVAGGLLSLISGSVSQGDWQTFNASIGGRLQVGVPYSQPCFPSNAGGPSFVTNASVCSELQARNEDHVFRAQHFGSYQMTHWEQCQATNDQCLMDWTDPSNSAAFGAPNKCSQGSVPPVFLEVNTVDDVVKALTFSKKTKVPLVIKNSGHDYIGRSAGPGTLALWMKNLQNLYLQKQFVPSGCAPGTKPELAMTIGAGQQFRPVFAFAKANNVTFVGGSDPSVGASGGWVMGGGHSGLSPSMGLAVDRVLEFKLVTPDGVLRTANKCQNADLFFALRGGGGGTFGVVLETTHIVSPAVTLQIVLGRYDGSIDSSRTLIKELAKGAVALAADGWGGFITPSGANGIWLHPSLSGEEARKSSQSIYDAFAKVNGTTTSFVMPTFTDFFETFIAPKADPVGRPQVMASRLIPDKSFADESLIDSMIDGMLASDFSQILAIAPYNVKDSGTSINPAWRNAVWHSLMSYYWNFDSTPADRISQYQKLTELWAVVRERTPDAAVYQNEADIFEPNYKTSFWGPNYNKLLEIKNKYDPDHILDCWHCIGWKGASEPRYKCYPDPTPASSAAKDEL